MQFIIFLFLLVFHILICKLYIKSMTTPFFIYGVIWFTVLAFTRLPIIVFEPYSLLTMAIFIGSYIAFLIPNCFLTKKKIAAHLDRNPTPATIHTLKKAYNILFPLMVLFTGLYIFLMIRHYGSLSFIIRNAYYVRYDAMGKEIVPVYVTYCLGFGYAAAGVSSYLIFFTKTNLKLKIYYMMPLVFSIASDLLTSGRMGMLFYGIIYFGALLLKISCATRREKRKYLTIFLLALAVGLVVLFIPKYLRDASVGGSDYSGYLQYLNSEELKNLPLIGPFMHYYIYITGPVVAFDKYIVSFSGGYTFGQAQFLPIVHLFGRLFGFETEYSILYDFVEVPFDTNIYSYLREAYSDFGLLGVILTPLCLGVLSYVAGAVRFRSNAVNFGIYQYLYVYVIFSIFYSPFSQGGPAVGFFIYFVILAIIDLVFTYDKQEINNGQLCCRDV